MGLEWLNQVKQTLQEAGVRVESGYPAHKAVHLTQSVAAVNLKAMEGDSVTEVLVTILTPRMMGLEQCQSQSAQTVQILTTTQSCWSFDGWRYEEGIDCWAVEIRGVPVQVEETESYTVLLGEKEVPFVADFLARQVQDRRLIRPHGQGDPAGVIPGKQGWELELTQMIPAGQPEPEEEKEPFTLTVSRSGHEQVYSGCRWTEYCSRQMPEGTQIVRKALALSREVSTDGSDDV